MSLRFVGGKVLGALGTFAFVVVFNFFLFRVVETNPVGTLFRGRNLTVAQRAELRHQFGLDGSRLDQFWHYLVQLAHFNLGRSYETNATSGLRRRPRSAPSRKIISTTSRPGMSDCA